MHSGDFFVCFCQSWSLKRHGCPEEGRHGAVVAAAEGRAGLGWASLGFYWVPCVCYYSRLFI